MHPGISHLNTFAGVSPHLSRCISPSESSAIHNGASARRASVTPNHSTAQLWYTTIILPNDKQNKLVRPNDCHVWLPGCLLCRILASCGKRYSRVNQWTLLMNLECDGTDRARWRRSLPHQRHGSAHSTIRCIINHQEVDTIHG